ncbi:MAG: hypothetical protein ACLFR1_16155 [Spirochaetia bacterium]
MTGDYYTTDLLQQESIAEMHSPHVFSPGIYSAVADAYGYGHFIEELSSTIVPAAFALSVLGCTLIARGFLIKDSLQK